MASIINPSQRAIKDYPADERWMLWDNTTFRPYTDIAEAVANVAIGRRHIGLYAVIGNALYWYKDGITDSDLVLFSAGAGGGIGFESAATFSAISTSTAKRLVVVDADETNNNDSILYLHNGTTLKFLLILS